MIARHMLGGLVVLAASTISMLAARGFSKPYAAPAPAFRQKGSASAPVVIAEYSDLQCPGCAWAQGTLKQLEQLYGPSLRVVFKHFPLERRHPRSRGAARAADCAGRQGKFWELADLLFEKQSGWSVETPSPDDSWILPYARQSGLELKAFSACLKDAGVDQAINADIKDGENQWISSTPTFFINGRRFAGAQQLANLGPLWIEKQIAKNRKRKQTP